MSGWIQAAMQQNTMFCCIFGCYCYFYSSNFEIWKNNCVVFVEPLKSWKSQIFWALSFHLCNSMMGTIQGRKLFAEIRCMTISPQLFWTLLKFAVSKQEKVKDYPLFEFQVNSAFGHINVTQGWILERRSK